MKKRQSKALKSISYLFVFLIFLSAMSCGASKRLLSAPEKNVIADYVGPSTKHQVLGVIWRVPLVDPGYQSLEFHHYGSPATTKDGKRVFSGAKDGSFFCLDAATGEVLWRNLTEGPVEGEPLVTDEMVYVGSGDGHIYAFRLHDGEKIWSYKASQAFLGRLALQDERLVGVTNNNTMFCLDAQTGQALWSYHRDAPSGLFQVRGVASPLIVDNKVYGGFSDGSLVLLSLESGEVLATKNFAKIDADFIDMDSDPLVVDELLVVGSFSSGVIALDRNTLDEVWRYEVEGPSSPVLDKKNKIIYFSTAKSKIFALNAKDGKPIWSFAARKGKMSRPVLTKDWLLISSSEYSLLTLSRSNGKLIQIFNPGKGAHSIPCVKNNRAYWISNGEVLYAMEIRR